MNDFFQLVDREAKRQAEQQKPEEPARIEMPKLSFEEIDALQQELAPADSNYIEGMKASIANMGKMSMQALEGAKQLQESVKRKPGRPKKVKT